MNKFFIIFLLILYVGCNVSVNKSHVMINELKDYFETDDINIIYQKNNLIVEIRNSSLIKRKNNLWQNTKPFASVASLITYKNYKEKLNGFNNIKIVIDTSAYNYSIEKLVKVDECFINTQKLINAFKENNNDKIKSSISDSINDIEKNQFINSLNKYGKMSHVEFNAFDIVYDNIFIYTTIFLINGQSNNFIVKYSLNNSHKILSMANY